MRISDWSSDVCSSDLRASAAACAARIESLLLRRQRLVGGRSRAEDELSLLAQHRQHQKDALHRARKQLPRRNARRAGDGRSEEHTSELQSLMRNSYAVFCLKKQTKLTHSKDHASKTMRTT